MIKNLDIFREQLNKSNEIRATCTKDEVLMLLDELNRLYAQEAERKAELDNIHNTILPRLTEELRKLQEERDRYRNALKEIIQEYKDWDRIGGTPYLMSEIAIKALKGASQ